LTIGESTVGAAEGTSEVKSAAPPTSFARSTIESDMGRTASGLIGSSRAGKAVRPDLKSGMNGVSATGPGSESGSTRANGADVTGARVGISVGLFVGSPLGDTDGDKVGISVGALVGMPLGDAEGDGVGSPVGLGEGMGVG
jgi:hypothetical protein